MEKNSRYLLIGVFVTLGLVMLVFFAVWLAGTHDRRHYERYTIHFNDPVNGLKTSATVQYRGVDVGRVIDVRLSGDNNSLIKVDVEVADTTPVFAKTEAMLSTAGLTGIVFVSLSTPDNASEPPPHPAGERYPVIRGKGTQLAKLFQDVPQISTQVLELSQKLNRVFNEENMAALDETFGNVRTLSEDMSRLVSEENINNTTTALQNIASSSENINDLVERFNHTADEIDRAVGTLNDVLTDNKEDIDRFAGSGLRQITEMSRETKEMARAIRRLADRLEQEPSRLLYQPNYRGVEIQE